MARTVWRSPARTAKLARTAVRVKSGDPGARRGHGAAARDAAGTTAGGAPGWSRRGRLRAPRGRPRRAPGAGRRRGSPVLTCALHGDDVVRGFGAWLRVKVTIVSRPCTQVEGPAAADREDVVADPAAHGHGPAVELRRDGGGARTARWCPRRAATTSSPAATSATSAAATATCTAPAGAQGVEHDDPPRLLAGRRARGAGAARHARKAVLAARAAPADASRSGGAARRRPRPARARRAAPARATGTLLATGAQTPGWRAAARPGAAAAAASGSAAVAASVVPPDRHLAGAGRVGRPWVRAAGTARARATPGRMQDGPRERLGRRLVGGVARAGRASASRPSPAPTSQSGRMPGRRTAGSSPAGTPAARRARDRPLRRHHPDLRGLRGRHVPDARCIGRSAGAVALAPAFGARPGRPRGRAGGLGGRA